MKDYSIDKENVHASYNVQCRECNEVISTVTLEGGSSAEDLDMYMRLKPEPCKSLICVQCQREMGIETDRDDSVCFNRKPEYCQCVDCQKILKEKYSPKPYVWNVPISPNTDEAAQ